MHAPLDVTGPIHPVFPGIRAGARILGWRHRLQQVGTAVVHVADKREGFVQRLGACRAVERTEHGPLCPLAVVRRRGHPHGDESTANGTEPEGFRRLHFVACDVYILVAFQPPSFVHVR